MHCFDALPDIFPVLHTGKAHPDIRLSSFAFCMIALHLCLQDIFSREKE
jgi:hypothetical protein